MGHVVVVRIMTLMGEVMCDFGVGSYGKGGTMQVNGTVRHKCWMHAPLLSVFHLYSSSYQISIVNGCLYLSQCRFLWISIRQIR
jgi:hypothetical protein